MNICMIANTAIESIESDFDFSGVQEVLNNSIVRDRLDFKEILSDMILGEGKISFEKMWNLLMDALFLDVSYYKEAIMLLILIGISAAVFANISSAFAEGQVAETSFYITYLLFVSVIVVAFYTVSDTAAKVLSDVSDFMEALVPSFFLAVGMVSGSAASVIFYEIALCVILVVDKVLLNIIIPLINVYVVIIMVNYLSKEDFLTKLAELLQTAVKWLLNTLLALTLGLNVIQGLIMPLAGSVKNSALVKAVSIIPGIGSGAGAVWETMLGTGAIIKNGIGTAALVAIIFMALMPLVKMAVFVLMYQGAGAVLQPISDKRVNEALSGVCEGAKMLLRTVFMTVVLFAVSIAIICASTNGGV